MTSPAHKIRMKFRCDQDVEQMLKGVDGTPYCEVCQKSLVDFRTKSLAEVVAYTNENKSCGIFKTEHVESDYVYELPLSAFRKYFLAIGAFLVAETGYSQITNNSPQIVSTNNPQVETKPEANKEAKSVYTKKGLVLMRAPHYSFKSSYYEYGIFVRRKFPCLSFRRLAARRTISGFW